MSNLSQETLASLLQGKLAFKVYNSKTNKWELVNVNNPELAIHAGAKASVYQAGHVQLTNALDSNSEVLAPTAKAIKTVFEAISAHVNDESHIEPSDLNTINEKIEGMFNFAPSVLKIPLKESYRGWQGVTVHNDLIYVFSDRNEDFGLENIISVYNLNGEFVKEQRNAYTGKDPNGKFMSFGDGNIIDGFLYVTAYNINGGGTPFVSRIIKYNPETLAIVSVHEIGGNVAESVTKHRDSYWVASHDTNVVKRFDLSFKLIGEYTLATTAENPHGGFQGSLWEDDYYYVNAHGYNFNENFDTLAELRKYHFNGTSFTFVESIVPPTYGCTQGVSKYGDYYFWNDRPNNEIVISKSLSKGNVYAESKPIKKEDTVNITMLNGFDIFDATYGRNPKATKKDNIVYLSGITKIDTEIVYADERTPILHVPLSYAPKYSTNFMAMTNIGTIRLALVGKQSTTNPELVGKVIPSNPANLEGVLQWISLDGISYPIFD